MSGPKLPSVRLPPLTSGQGDAGKDGVQEGVVVELPPSNKFGFAWPTEAIPPVQQPSTSERPVSLSSSEGESESDHESDSPTGRHSHTDHSDDPDTTPASTLKSQLDSLSEEPPTAPGIPRISRAFSMPLPSQLGHLQNPHRGPLTKSDSPSPLAVESPADFSQFHELSLELADSVQMMIQTLLQVSPPQVLDPAKEQFSACSLSVPTPSMSALFTTMKNLNYISANMANFCAESPNASYGNATRLLESSVLFNDFDIGEMLQSVGDALSGAAAQAGVDLVLFHGDVGMKHVSVRGDESGISYALSHVIRQVINTAREGDSIEIGLFIGPATRRTAVTLPVEDATAIEDPPRSASIDPELEGSLQCTFEVTHKYSPSDSLYPPGDTPQDTSPPARPKANLDTLLLKRLLLQLGASLNSEGSPNLLASGNIYAMTMTLGQGSSSVVNPPTPAEEIPYQVFLDQRIASEPTLDELMQFTESLKGKKVTLHASSKGSFARHLTSYLTAWGLDVSHVSSEPGVEGIANPGDGLNDECRTFNRMAPGSSTLTPYGAPFDGSTSQDHLPQAPPAQAPAKPEGRSGGQQSLSFIFIDDDVDVLRERLQKLRTEQPYQLNLHSRKRPSLASHHRPRSSPHVVRVMGLTPALPPPPSPVVVVHFTSLANFKLVKDVVQSVLTSQMGPSAIMPEVMIIPKPAGPRRLLTALHTAVTKPMVDPFFAPIATSPISPGAPHFSPHHSTIATPQSPTSTNRPSGASRTNSDRSRKSPKESVSDPTHLLPPSPLGMSDGMEYFSEAAVKLGSSPSSGLVIQSPDGQPAGIFFHPRARTAKNSPSSSLVMERDRGQLAVPADRNRGSASRRPSDERRSQAKISFSSLHAMSVSQRGPQAGVNAEELTDIHGSSSSTPRPKGKRPSSPRTEEHPSSDTLQTSTASTPRRSGPLDTAIRKMSTPPVSPLSDTNGQNSSPRRGSVRRPVAESKPTTPPGVSKKGKNPADANIVPPISVLIVDDNPINQTILSTFMRKKKIKYDVAKNGEEAVQKWRTGGFHLILMDIQMPVMDGIQATKEIRRMEKSNALAGYPPTPVEEQRAPLRTPSDNDSRSSASPYRSSVIIVALTASSLQSDRVAALAAGCNDFLTKPVSLLWLNNKIIEWGSIKALQMWADLRPEVVKSISTDQAAQARNVAQRLHVPDGRGTPTGSPSRSSSVTRSALPVETPTSATPSSADFRSPTQVRSSGNGDSVESQRSTDSSANSSEPSPPAVSGVDAPIEFKNPDVTDLPPPSEQSLPSNRVASDNTALMAGGPLPTDELPSTANNHDTSPPDDTSQLTH